MKKKIFYVMLSLVLILSFSLIMAVPTAAANGYPFTGYEIITAGPFAYGDGGWGGWSVPAGKVVLGGGFYATAPVSASAPGTPGSVWPHYTYGADEYGWCVRDAQDGVSNTITIYVICADAPAGYGVVKSSALNYSDGGWGGWSVPAGKVVLGGGYELSAGSAAASAPATPSSVWPHYTYGADEYGWVVRGAEDGYSSPGSYVYAIYADAPAGYGVVKSSALNYSDGGWGGWSVPAGTKVLSGGYNLTGGPAAVSAPGTPGSVWPHYTYGADEYGWCVRDLPEGHSSPNSFVYAVYAEVAVTVDIDIKPCSDPNSINLDSKGVVPVAILGSADFDASTVDPETVELAGAPAQEKGKSGKYGSLDDVNGDGYLDLVIHVRTADLELNPGDTVAVLTGNLYDSTPILGSDSVRTVPD
jgi:hypothetical protein